MSTRRVFNLEALKQQYQDNNNGSANHGNYYGFWDMPVGGQAIVRFLPDKDFDNPNFLLEKVYHELIIDGNKRKVPCLWSYDKERCPICEESQRYYKEEGDNSVTGRQLYKKRQYVGQVLVMNDPLPPNPETGKNSNGEVKLITIRPKIYKVIKETIAANELDDAPHSYDAGTNFIIKKAQDGKYADYSLSKFERKSSAIEDELIDSIEEQLTDLKSLVAPKPERATLVKLLNDHFNGSSSDSSDDTAYDDSPDEDDTSSYSKPAPVKPAAAAPKVSAPSMDDDVDEDEAAQLLLKQIRERRSRIAAE